MKTVKLPHWLQTLVATLGGGGIFVVAFLDSSVLSFPFVTDALVIESSIERPARMPYYCAMAAAGSLAGCVWLYLLAKKGGEAYFQRRAGRGAERIRGWVQRNAFVSTFVPAILPPPFPFKVFVLADGVFQVPLRTFVLALLVGRGLRYFVEGMLAVRYGPVILKFAMAHETMLAGSVFFTLAILYIAGRSMFSGPRLHM
ncbi:MAG: VTT domain-containing protein [Candidatus Acidiferrales bacterium]